MRYFPNRYPDYPGGQIQYDTQVYLSKARQVANFILANFKHAESNVDGGLYVGPAGIAYSLWKLSHVLKDHAKEESEAVLKSAEKLIEINLNYVQRPDLQKDKQNKVGFLLGSSGVLAVASVIKSPNEHIRKFRQILTDQNLTSLVVHRCGSDELFVGKIFSSNFLNLKFHVYVIFNFISHI